MGMIWEKDKHETVGVAYGLHHVDYITIVRCKDCDNKECWGRGGDVVCGIDGTPHRPDWFCADGERRDE